MSEIRRFNDESEFLRMRANIVLTLNQWSHPLMKTGYSREFMANEMRAMAIIVDEFALRYDQRFTGPCFMERCYRLGHVLTTISTLVEVLDHISMRARVFALNMFNVFADQIGRLTLHGYDSSDEHAMIMAEKAKSETHFFDGRYSDAECEAIRKELEELWNYLHWFKRDCVCHNCIWECELKNELDRRFENNMITSERLIAESLRIVPLQPEALQPETKPFQPTLLQTESLDIDPFNFGRFRMESVEPELHNTEAFQIEASGSQSMNANSFVAENFNIEAFIESLKDETLEETEYNKIEPGEAEFYHSLYPFEGSSSNTEFYNSPYNKTEPFEGESQGIKFESGETNLYIAPFIRSEF